jgi:hypothetical protein
MVGWVSLGTYFESNPQIQWRLLLALQLVAPLILLAGSWLLPESPRWLASKGRERQGKSQRRRTLFSKGHLLIINLANP